MIKVASFNCNSVRNNAETVKSLLENYDLVFLQELMLSKSDLVVLNDFNKNFQNIAFVNDREAEGINEGRPSRGVAIFYRNELSTCILPLLIDDRSIGVVLSHGSRKILMLNVYMPCDLQTRDALDSYKSMLAKLDVIVREQNIGEVIFAGDFNADPNKGRFWSELISFKENLSLAFIDGVLPNDSFTYLCPARSITSWLDHIFCTVGIEPFIVNVGIDYYSSIFDHFCIYFWLDIDFEHSPAIDTNESLIKKMVKWNGLSNEDTNYISNIIEKVTFSEGVLLHNVFNCKLVNCTDATHREYLDVLFDKAIDILLFSTDEFSYEQSDSFRVIPGWNDYCKKLYDEARTHFHKWRLRDKPTFGVYNDNMRVSRSIFKAALQNCKVNEDRIRKEKLLSNLKNKNFKCFWNEVHNIKKNNDSVANNIDGEVDPTLICDVFSEKYKKIFAMGEIRSVESECFVDGRKDKCAFSKVDIKKGIGKLKCGIGLDGIHSNHLKNCPDVFIEFLSLLLESFVFHRYMPGDMIKGVINPTIKDRFGNIASSDNYRPVMQSSMLLKLFEYCLLEKVLPFVELSDSQHGFRSNHSTVTACAVLKETIFNYRESGSDVYACFLDISKAFDTVDHNILMQKLLKIGVPAIYVNAIQYLYSNQFVRVRYQSTFSESWRIHNGVRQGGVISGLLFGVYIDSLLVRIQKSKYGCKLGILKSNVVAYADDLVLLAPSSASLQILINEAVDEVHKLKLKFNKSKSKWMIFHASKSSSYLMKDKEIDGETIEKLNEFKYLGFMLRSDLSNVDDIQRAVRKFYCDFNSILRKFSFADVKVKLYLFKYYCLQLYGVDLWLKDRGSTNAFGNFAVAYHKAIKKILGLSTHESNHYACQEAELFIFKHLINKFRINTALRLVYSPCNYFRKNMSFLKISSVFIKSVEELARDTYDIDLIWENDLCAINARIAYVQNHEGTMR